VPVEPVEDLSIYLLTGRVTAAERPGYTWVGRGIDDAVDAERLGFSRVWLSERYDLKDAGALLGGVAARTTRLGVGTGALSVTSRNPVVTASLGSTMHGLYGPRFTLGLGRGVPMLDMPECRLADLVAYARAVAGIWRGETVTYEAFGRPPVRLKALDVLDGIAPPRMWYCTYGGPKAAQAAADPAFDGVMLYPALTVDAVAAAVERIRSACERSGRDPASLRICHPIVVAADLDDVTTRSYAHARLLTYLEWPGHGETVIRANGWDPGQLTKVRGHDLMRAMNDRNADQSYHRAELLRATEVLPDELVGTVAAIGSTQHCVDTVRRFRAAGVDEIAVYGSTPAENESVVKTWRETA